MRHPVRWLAPVVTVLCLASCEKSGPANENPAPSAAPTSSAPATNPGPSGKTPAPPPSASAAEAPAETNGLAGTWEGTYEAKLGYVEMPPKVKDKVRAKDDGKAAIGPGKISITIGPDGELGGKTEGALGAATLKGKVEGDAVSGMFTPDDGLAKGAMFGIVQGKHKEGRIEGRIRVASGDAAVVREAEINLKKK
jgi:hypothetical protein